MSLTGDVLPDEVLMLDNTLAEQHQVVASPKVYYTTALQHGLHTLTYPVLTLPVEVTSLIFVAYHQDQLSRDGEIGVSPTSPMPLTRICRAWRNIALGTPELWTYAYLFLHNRLPDNWDTQLINWFARSHTLQVSFRIRLADDRGIGHDRPLRALRGVLETIAPKLREFRILDMSWDEFGLLDDAERPALHFPVLAILELDLTSWDSEQLPPKVLFHRDRRPALREVTLGLCTRPHVLGDSSSITKYTGQHLAPDWWLAMPALQYCDLTTCDVTFEESSPPFRHTQLRELKILLEDAEADCSNFFDAATLPSLESLEIDSSTAPPAFCFGWLDAFMERSNPPLRSLTLCTDDMEVPRAFSRSGVETLVLTQSSPSLVREFFLALGSETNFFRGLRNLAFRLWYNSSHDPDIAPLPLFVEPAGNAIAERNRLAEEHAAHGVANPVQSLKSFKVVMEWPKSVNSPAHLFSDEELRPLRRIKAAGMDICFTHLRNGVETRLVDWY